MATGRKAMLRELQRRMVPVLRDMGFSGSLPHFRRTHSGTIDFLSVQFDKWGGGFVLEVGQARLADLETESATAPVEELTSYHLPLTSRARLQPAWRLMTDGWFRYDRRRPWWRFWERASSARDQQQQAAGDVLRLLPQAEAWWRGERPQPNIHLLLDRERAPKPSR